MRGFNYNTVSSLNYNDEWLHYNHAEVDRDMGYAQRLHLNIARVFMSYRTWSADKAAYREKLKDFVRTAYAHGVGTMVTVVDGPGQMMPDLFADSARPGLLGRRQRAGLGASAGGGAQHQPAATHRGGEIHGDGVP